MNNTEINLFLKKLDSKIEDDLLKTLDYFRSNGDPCLMKEVLTLLKVSKSQVIKDAVISIVSDLRNLQASEITLNFIIETADRDIKLSLLQALWQSSADLSNSAESIINLIINNNDFGVAFEALTLLENNAENINKSSAEKLITLIKSNSSDLPSEIEPLRKAAENHLNKFLISDL